MDATKKQKKKKRKRPHQKHAGAASLAKRYPFATDFCDHFETPRRAYADVAPALDALVAKPRAETRIYDPYYCDGAAKRHLQASSAFRARKTTRSTSTPQRPTRTQQTRRTTSS